MKPIAPTRRALLIVLLACICGAARANDSAWLSPQLREHPLAGSIWDAGNGRSITREALLDRLAGARVILLGETHDNADHHRLQTTIHSAMLARGLRPALAMEQFDLEHQPAIDAARIAKGANARSVANAGQMREAWNFDFYAPLIDQAIAADTPLLAANLSRDAARRVMREGFAALGGDRAGTLGIDAAWDAGREQRLRHDIVEGHCGQVPDDLLPGLVAAQRARDALMADVMLGHAQRGVIGIVGRGHARRDLGVPRYLGLRDARLDTVSVGMLEVEHDRLRVEDYAAELARFDYLWFTPRAQRKDPCAGFSLRPGR